MVVNSRLKVHIKQIHKARMINAIINLLMNNNNILDTRQCHSFAIAI